MGVEEDHPKAGHRPICLGHQGERMRSIELAVRYGREIADPEVESHEKNLRYGELNWRLPLAELVEHIVFATV